MTTPPNAVIEAVEQEQSTAPEGANTADDGLVKAIARVAHEVVAGHNTAYGNYTTPSSAVFVPSGAVDCSCSVVMVFFLSGGSLLPDSHLDAVRLGRLDAVLKP